MEIYATSIDYDEIRESIRLHEFDTKTMLDHPFSLFVMIFYVYSAKNMGVYRKFRTNARQ